MTRNTILPGAIIHGQPATLGVMGGGQLGRMFVQAAQRMGYFTAVLDPDPASPAGLLSHHHIQTDYLDEQGLAQLMQRSSAITTEFENVPAPALRTLGARRPVAPAADAVAIAQDRAREKAHFTRCGVPVAPHALIETAEQLAAVAEDPSMGADLFPGILKTSRLGYDGKGQMRVKTRAELAAAWDHLQRVPCLLEKMLPLKAECSVIVARGWDGQMVNFPVQRNLHRDGILAVTEIFEGNVPATLAAQAIAATKSVAEGLGYVGVLCVEFFILENDTLVVNEMAPRPHNSGHYTLDACDQSQFDLQVKTLAGLPLVQPRPYGPSIMLNLLGDVWPENRGHENRGQIPINSHNFSMGTKLESDPDFCDPDFCPSWDRVLALPGTHLHLYGKLKASQGRKMGHLNITGSTVEEVRATALEAARILGIAPF